MNKKTFRSIAAVLAGFIAVFVLSVLTDSILENMGVFPPQNDPAAYTGWMLLLALVYRSIFTVVGGYIAAALAPDRPMRHVMILGIIGFMLATLGLVANLNRSTPSNAWYPIMIVILAVPCVWLGGKIRSNLRDRKA
jgi:MFS family permease